MEDINNTISPETPIQTPVNIQPIIDSPKNNYKTLFFLFLGLFIVVLIILTWFLINKNITTPTPQSQNKITGNIIIPSSTLSPTVVQNVTVANEQSKTIPADQTALKDAVFSAVDSELKVKYQSTKDPGYMTWDRKVDVTNIDLSQKAAKGVWFMKDAWDWIAWEQDENTWKVLLSFDGFDCKELDNIPSQYFSFFKDIIQPNWIKDPNNKYCY